MTSEDASTAVDGLIANMEDTQKMMAVARMCESMERWEDMCTVMKKIVETRVASQKEVDVDERNLLSVAYKNVVGHLRSSFRTLQSTTPATIQGDAKSVMSDKEVQDIIDKYSENVAMKVRGACNEVIALLTKVIDRKEPAKEAETEVFYKKMKADYYRYLSELKGDSDGQTLEEMGNLYKEAMDTAKAKLPETHPTRLGLALNYSVAFYEILKEHDKACALAKDAFDAAIEKLDTLNDASYKDSTLIMQLLRDNLTLWTSEKQNQADGDGGEDNP